MQKSITAKLKWIFLLILALPTAVFSCDVTLSDGSDLHRAAKDYSGKKICLNAGNYYLGGETLNLGVDTVIEGLAPDRNSVYIYSDATRAISVNDRVTLKNFLISGRGGSSEFGILSYQKSNVTLWGLRVQNFLINIGVVGGSSIGIWDVFMSYNGDTANGRADPNLWVTDSDSVTVLYGEARGRGNGPGGDGEIAFYNSTNVVVDGIHSNDCGASAIYMVNCDSCKIKNTTIYRPGEWGLDVVTGSDNFEATGNYVAFAKFGGAVFDEAGSIGGTFTNNGFYYNRGLGVGNCNGINVIGSTSGVVESGNWSNPAGIICIK